MLHAPGECEYCDTYAPDLQEIRVQWGINFTGHHDPGKYVCPAEEARPLSAINDWGGNTPDGSGRGFYHRFPNHPIPTDEEVEASTEALKRSLDDLAPPS